MPQRQGTARGNSKVKKSAHRKRVLAAHDALTLTGLYNVLVKVGAGDTALSIKEKAVHEKGLAALEALGRTRRLDDGRWLG